RPPVAVVSSPLSSASLRVLPLHDALPILATVPVTVIGMADIGDSSAVWLRASGADALAFSQHRDPWWCPGMRNALWKETLRPQGIRGRVARAVFKSQPSSS